MDKKTKFIEMLKENTTLTTDINEAIYAIDALLVSGEFEEGYRSVDHNILTNDEFDWQFILENGTIIIPENEQVIGEQHLWIAKELGYEVLPLDNNHIMGKQESVTYDMDYDIEL